MRRDCTWMQARRMVKGMASRLHRTFASGRLPLMRFAFAVVFLGLALHAPAAQIYSEPFTGGSNGWIAVTNTPYVSFVGNGVRFRIPFSFLPLSASLQASNGASSGAFVGNYATAGVKAVSFSLICTASVPGQVQLDMISGTNRIWRLLGGQACMTGRWMNITASLASEDEGEWFSSTPGLYASVLSNVTEVQVQMTPRPNPAVQQTFFLDDFALKSASALQSVSPSSFTYADTVTGQVAQASIAVTNRGTVSMAGTALVFGVGFSLATASNYVLEAGASTNFVITFNPTTNGSYAGQLNLLSSGGSLGVALLGQGIGAPVLGVAPATLAFGNVVTGHTAQAAFTVTNAGGSILTGSVLGVSAPFALAGGGSYVLEAGAATNVVLDYSPPDVAAHSNTIVFLSNGGTQTGSVIGAGVDVPLLAASPALFSYTGVVVGAYADAVFVISNRGSQVLNGNTQINPPFSVISGADYALEPGSATTAVIRFTPVGAAPITNDLEFLSNGGSSTSRLTGSGVLAPLLAIDPPAFSFGGQPTGTTAQTILIVSNRGSALLTGTVEVPGPTFGILLGDSYTLQPGEWQQLIIGFSPSAVQAYSNNLLFESNAGGSTNALTGQGILPPQFGVSPGTFDFGAVPVLGQAQANFVVTNSGQATLAGTAVAAGSGFAVVQGAAFTVAGGGSTNVLVTFNPPTLGSFTGSVTFLSNGGQATGLLSGTSFQLTGDATNVFVGLSGGQVILLFEVTSGAWYHVEATTNLLDPTGWASLSATNRATGGTIQFNDGSPLAPQRSYRVHSP